jgi:3-dehydroquinate dehydratase/shikimate dehydrogenase
MTRLCVPIFVETFEQARRDIALAGESGAEIVELRIDTFHDLPQLRELIASSGLPVIVTMRRAGEGGQCDLPDTDRIELLRQAAQLGATWVDLEHDTARQHPGAIASMGVPVIESAHDFETRPPKLYSDLQAMAASDSAVSKVAWKARSIRDNIEAFELLLNRAKPSIALCMGESGILSRVLAKKFNAFLTFASLSSDRGTAPGQPTIGELLTLYRWRAINPKTRVYGVVGAPVAHSMSPAIHNAAFDEIDFDGVYLPMLVSPEYESFKAFAELFVDFDPLHLGGLSVTIPHKENALRWLLSRGAQVDELAKRIGAVNTIVVDRDRDGKVAGLRGFSSDYDAILDTITAALDLEREALAQMEIAVLGAGGTGRTAVAALAACGARVVVYNRSIDRAEALAREFDRTTGTIIAAPMDRLDKLDARIVVNTTPIGMHPNVDASPIDGVDLAGRRIELVFDTIYNPLKTKLLEQAELAGIRTAGGIEMFVRQAARQFEAWTGKPAPTDTMRRVVENRLRS